MQSATSQALPSALARPPPLRCSAALDLTGAQSFAPELQRLLALLSVPVTPCHSGREAIVLAARSELRCVFTGQHLPDMSAIEFISRLRRRAPRLPVIMVAGQLAMDATVAAMRCGAHAVIDARALQAGLLRHVPGLSSDFDGAC